MGQNILHCIVYIWKNTKETEHLTQIPKPHLSTSLIINESEIIIGFLQPGWFIFCLVNNSTSLNWLCNLSFNTLARDWLFIN